MLNTVIGAVIGFLGLAVTADWLSWHKRTVGALKARAELMQAMSPGVGW